MNDNVVIIGAGPERPMRGRVSPIRTVAATICAAIWRAAATSSTTGPVTRWWPLFPDLRLWVLAGGETVTSPCPKAVIVATGALEVFAPVG